MDRTLSLLGLALLAISAALHLYFGAAFAIDPEPLMANLSIAATSNAGLAELRAFYGGLMLALGALFAVAVVRPSARRAGLRVMVVTYLGAAAVRGASIAIDSVQDPLLVQLLAIEVIGGGLGALALLGRDPHSCV